MKNFDVIIVGAGPGGLLAAREAAAGGLSVALVEAQSRAGRKLSMAGGGMGNITNRTLSEAHYIGAQPSFCKNALRRFRTEDALQVLADMGIAWEEREYGQIFCLEAAHTLARRMLDAAEAQGVRFFSDAPVRQCLRQDDHFLVRGEGLELEAPFLLLANGSPACPQAGANESGARLAHKLGHHLLPYHPVLVPFIMPPHWPLHGLEGISRPVRITVDTDKGPAGDPCDVRSLLFTHRGISGPAVLVASCHWKEGQALVIDFLPEENLREVMHQPQNGKQKVKTLVARRMQDRLAERLVPADLAERKVAELGRQDRERLCAAIHAHRVIPEKTEGMRKAEAASGGVDVAEIKSTMESRLVSGLYFCGEIMDLTGLLGGYNIHWALASAFVASHHIVKAVKKSRKERDN